MSQWVLPIIVVALITLYFLNRKVSKNSPTTSGYSGWHILYSPGMPSVPEKVPSCLWRITFPQKPNHVDYVQNFTPPKIQYGRSLVAHFTVVGGGFCPQESPAQPATVTLILQRRGDDGSAVGKYANYRWYSTKLVNLVQGVLTLSAVLDEKNFGGVYGGHDKQAFLDTLSNLESIGVVFGSAGGRGHGVYADPQSTFTLVSLEVQG